MPTLLDPECFSGRCPQALDGEPTKSNRCCPLDAGDDDEE